MADTINTQNEAIVQNIAQQVKNNTMNLNQSSSIAQQNVANTVASNLNKVLSTYGAQNISTIQNSLYSSGLNGYSVVPVYNSSGLVSNVQVIKNVATNQNLITLSNTPNNTTTVSSSSIIASPNTTVGYLNGIPVQSKNSSYTGAGYYLNSAGAPAYISNYAQYQQNNAQPSTSVSSTGTFMTYGNNGQLTSVIVNGKTTNIPAGSTAVYNSNGTINSVTTPSGTTLNFTNLVTQPVTATAPSSSTSSSGSSTVQQLYTTPTYNPPSSSSSNPASNSGTKPITQPVQTTNTPTYTVSPPSSNNSNGVNIVNGGTSSNTITNHIFNPFTNNTNNYSVTTTIPNTPNMNNTYNKSITTTPLNVSKNLNLVQTITSPAPSLGGFISSFFGGFHW